MKKWTFLFNLATCALFCISLVGCNVDDMTNLKDVSRPYVGEYKCKELTFGGEDRLKEFESVKLNFDFDESFCLRAVDLNGNESTYAGSYKFTENQVTLSASVGGEEKTYVFPYESGAVHMQLLFREKLLYARFSMID